MTSKSEITMIININNCFKLCLFNFANKHLL